MTSSLQKFGIYIRHLRQENGWTQLELSIKVFKKPNYEFISRLERGSLSGITFTTADKILFELGCEMDFSKFKN